VVKEAIMVADDWKVHQTPVWKYRANFIIDMIVEEEPDGRKVWEQLWSEETGENLFKLCCIPFFVYDLNFGDEVETRSEAEQRYVVNRVVKRSEHYTFRVWFGGSDNPAARDEVMDEVERQGWLFEWYSKNLLAISVEFARAQDVADYLHGHQMSGAFAYETGRSR
jgi:Domain of unknown function (DUF4265)